MLNGDGLRVVLWVAGCDHCCKGCQNPLTWDPDGGLPFDEAAKQEIFDQLDKSYISGITFSGGDPLHNANRLGVRALIGEIKEKYPDKTIWVYTGSKWEDIWHYPIMKNVDVVVVHVIAAAHDKLTGHLGIDILGKRLAEEGVFLIRHHVAYTIRLAGVGQEALHGHALIVIHDIHGQITSTGDLK